MNHRTRSSRLRSSRWLPPALSARRRAPDVRPRAAARVLRHGIEGADPFMTEHAIDEARRIGLPFAALVAAWRAVAALAALVFAKNATTAALVLLSTPVTLGVPRLQACEHIDHPGDFARVLVRTLHGLAAGERGALGSPQPYRRAVVRVVLRLRERFSDPAVWAPHVVGALLRFLGEDDSDLGPDALDRTLEALHAQNGGDRG